jgi:hypothetical protein
MIQRDPCGEGRFSLHSRRRRRRPRVSAARHLRVEPLEDRCLLSTSPGVAELMPPGPAAVDVPPAAATEADADQPLLLADGGLDDGETSPDDLWRSAVFNDRKLGTLDFDFSREVATVDPLGQPTEIDQPRYGAEESIIATSPWSLAVAGSRLVQIYGSGWDHDGTTALAVVYKTTANRMVFYRGDELTVQNSVFIHTQGYVDLLNGAVPGFRYIPRGGVVHEGLVVFQVERQRQEGDDWIPEGISFITTQDYGETLTRVPQVGGGFDVPGIAGQVSDGINRGRRWALTNAFPEKSANDMLGAWFPWADYLQKSGAPQGGQVGLFRARRPAVGAAWVIEPNKVVYERWKTDDSGGHHAHSAGMFTDGMVSFWGDVGYRNMMVRHVANDLEHYTDDVWTTVEEFNGAWSPDDAKVYNYGNQAASTAPGIEFGTVLTTGDEQPEVVMQIERPAEVGDKAIITSLVGSTNGRSAGSGYRGRVSLWIHHLRGHGYVAHEQSAILRGLNTIHYSSDGQHWASMTSIGDGLPVLYGDKFLQIDDGSIYVADWPSEAMPIQPLVVSPGGTNLSNDTWDVQSAPASGITLRAVMLQDGVYTYRDDGTLLDPQPNGMAPVMDQMPIWEVTSDGTTTDGGRRYLADIESDLSEFHWLTLWAYSMTGDGFEPRFKFGDLGAGNATGDQATRWVANNQWVPIENRGVPNSSDPQLSGNLLWVLDGLNPAPRRWLMVGQGFNQGVSPIYPLQPGTTGADELAVVDGFQTGDQWTVAMTFGLPQISAFSSQIDPVGAETVRPIATLAGEGDDRIEVYFTKTAEPTGQTAGTVWIDAYAGQTRVQNLSFPGVYLDKQDRVSLVIASTADQFGATLQVVRNSYPVVSKAQAKSTPVRLNAIYLSDASQTVVSPLNWYAVQVNPSTGLEADQREGMIVSEEMFHLLDAGARPGDMDMDGDVDFDDIDPLVLGLNNPAAYAKAFTVPATLHGDLDGDGDLDFDDIGAFVDLLAAARADSALAADSAESAASDTLQAVAAVPVGGPIAESTDGSAVEKTAATTLAPANINAAAGVGTQGVKPVSPSVADADRTGGLPHHVARPRQVLRSAPVERDRHSRRRAPIRLVHDTTRRADKDHVAVNSITVGLEGWTAKAAY